MEDEDSFEISMDGKPWMVGRFPHELRLRLWAEHLGLKPDEVHAISDPISDAVYNGIWLKTARENTAIYEKVFPSKLLGCFASHDRLTSSSVRYSPELPSNHEGCVAASLFVESVVSTLLQIFKSANGLQVPAPAVTDGSELAGVRGTLTMHPIGFLLDEEISTKLSLVLGENISQ